MTYSAAGQRAMLSTAATESPLELIEITHPDLAIPARFVNDRLDIIVDGNVYTATRFRLTRPDDVDRQTPQARLAVDNVGRDLTVWVEQSNGGKGARCRVMAVLRSSPSVKEFDMTLDLAGISIDTLEVSGGLGFQNTLGQNAVAVRFDPLTAPGCY
ncbi:MAG TPA: DUF1833 family protein [Burkholderiaceae bacterium]|nr:DUF1833 family protein [Burkholderiaceae bacterium]